MRHKMDRLGEADYPREDVERFSVMDEVDREIMQRLLEAGVDGLLPAVVAVDLNKRFGYTLHYYDVSRRLVRLNNRLQTETGKVLFEKRGAKKWALSKFGFDVYGATEEELSGVTPVGGSEEAEV
jgi:hypothetical protein